MKLEGLRIQNFQRIRELDLDLSGSSIHLFCGFNEDGKSTIADAIRFAIVGDSPRVDLKRDYDQLITHGAKKGFVEVLFDGGISARRNVKDGKADTSLGDMTFEREHSARLALGAQKFVDMKPDERRKLLFAVTQIDLSPARIISGLAARDIHPAVQKRINPLLQAGVETAWEYCRKEKQRLREAWTIAAGEAFGKEKAVTWKRDPPPPPPDLGDTTLADVEAQLVEQRQQLSQMEERRGVISTEIKQRATYDENLARLDTFVHNKSTYLADKESYEKDIANQLAIITEAQERIAAHERAQKIYTCPECTQHLVLNVQGELDYPAEDQSSDELQDAESIEDWRKKLAAAQRQKGSFEHELEKVKARLASVANEQNLRAEVTQKREKLAKPEDLTQINELIAEQAEAVSVVEAARDVMRTYESGVASAKKATEDAGVAYRQWKAFDDAEAALAPDGIPGEILNSALETINRRMLASAHLCGWAAPRITPEMGIIREAGEGQPEMAFGLLSESAQWRVSAIVADAISSMTGLKVLVLDRLDMLDIRPDGSQGGGNRARVLKWVKQLAEDDYDTILLMMTLKQKPEKMGSKIAVHWMENGTIKGAKPIPEPEAVQ